MSSLQVSLLCDFSMTLPVFKHAIKRDRQTESCSTSSFELASSSATCQLRHSYQNCSAPDMLFDSRMCFINVIIMCLTNNMFDYNLKASGLCCKELLCKELFFCLRMLVLNTSFLCLQLQKALVQSDLNFLTSRQCTQKIPRVFSNLNASRWHWSSSRRDASSLQYDFGT